MTGETTAKCFGDIAHIRTGRGGCGGIGVGLGAKQTFPPRPPELCRPSLVIRPARGSHTTRSRTVAGAGSTPFQLQPTRFLMLTGCQPRTPGRRLRFVPTSLTRLGCERENPSPDHLCCEPLSRCWELRQRAQGNGLKISRPAMRRLFQVQFLCNPMLLPA